MLQLKNKLVDEHIQLIQQLETKYSDHISTLLQQKAYIHKQIQLSFYEKLFELMQQTTHQDTVTHTDSAHSCDDTTNDVEIHADDVTNTTSSIQLTEEDSISRIRCSICAQTFYSDHELSQHMNIHRNNSFIPFVSNQQQSEETKSIPMDIDKPSNTSIIIPICSLNNNIESQTALMKTKTEAESFKNAGNALLKRRKYQQALDEYSKAIDLDDTNPVYYSNRAAAHYHLKHYEETKNDSRKAWSIDPNYIKAYIREGMAQYKMKYYQKAFVSYSKAHNKINSNDTNHKMHEEIQTKLKLCKIAMTKPNMNDKWCCDYCNKIFINQNSLFRHCKSHDECATNIALNINTKTNTNNRKTYKCKYCPYTAYRAGDLQKHQPIHERATPHAFKCEYCSYSAPTKALLTRHHLLHNKVQSSSNDVHDNIAQNRSNEVNDETFQCIYCPKTCKKQSQLDNHIINTHTPNYLKPNKCRYCVYAAATKTAIRLHETQLHNNIGTDMQRAFKCDICDNEFARKQHLAQHSKVHDARKPFLCTLCYKQFTEKQHLRQHIGKIHKNTNISSRKTKRTTIKKNSNEYVEDDSWSDINANINEESDEDSSRPKGFECCYCKSVFDKWDNLEIHMMKHKSEAKEVNEDNADEIKCSVCRKAFKEERYLKVHFRMHTGEKPYECDQCGERFRTYGLRDVHLRKHFEGYPYQCGGCKMRFKIKKELKNHHPYCALQNS